MIPVFTPIPFFIPTNNTLFAALQTLGYTAGLQTCLDASDAASYTSGQTWTDETGNGYSFFRGTNGTVEAADPTFNGTAGSQTSSTYWSVNGTQEFTLNQANPAWYLTLGKDSALFSICGWIYKPALSAYSTIFGSLDGSTPIHGIALLISPASALEFNAANNAGTAFALAIVSTVTVPANTWTFVAVTINEAATTGFLQVNGTQESKVTTYVSPDTNNPSFTAGILGFGGFNGRAPNGTRIANLAVWQGVGITQAQMLSVFTATRAKFGV
jgi:hypothetical protein